MAGEEIWAKSDGTVWLVFGNTRRQIPTTSGGVSQANMINASIRTGAIDKRPVFTALDMDYALQAKGIQL